MDRETLARCLPESEPPLRVRLEDVIRFGRRRRRIRAVAPAGAATLVALTIGSVFAAAGPLPPPPQQVWPPAPPTTRAGSSSTAPMTTNPTGSTVSGMPGVPTEQSTTTRSRPGTPSVPGGSTPISGAPPATPAPPLYEFRAPTGHSVDSAAHALTEVFVRDELPAERIGVFYGTRSDGKDAGDRYVYGGHVLWRDGERYGYLFWLQRTAGAVQLTAYGLPTDPCVDPVRPAPGERCEIRAIEGGGTEVRFDLDRGYRLRGATHIKKDPNGAPDVAVTLGFYLPGAGGGWPGFPNLSGQRALAEIPYSLDDLSRLLRR